MPTQKDVEEFIEVWKQQCGEVLSPLEARTKLNQLLLLLEDMAKVPPAIGEEPKKDPPPGFVRFWTGNREKASRIGALLRLW